MIACNEAMRENDMEWLAENWFAVLIGILFVGMHMFGHGHGGGGHGGHDSADKPGADAAGSGKPSGHQH